MVQPVRPVPVPIDVAVVDRKRPVQVWRAGGKIGNASVTPINVEEIQTVPSNEYGQNIITMARASHLGRLNYIDIDGDTITVMGIVGLPFRHNAAPLSHQDVEYKRRVGPNEPLNTTIVWHSPIEIGAVDPAVVAEFQFNGQLDARVSTNTMRAKVPMSNSFAIAAAPLLLEGTGKYDLSGLYVALFILLDYVYFLDREGVERVHGDIIQNAITMINVAAEGNDANVAIAAAHEALANNRIPLNRRDLTLSDLHVMDAVSAGTPYIRAADQENRFIHGSMRWGVINWVVILVAAEARPQAGLPTMADIQAFILKLAVLTANVTN